ncbi:hypothetical protein HBB16_09825 [Pseudonocardia sp. MCCB 268]|nr:hypothetical protein [Pseudonocardia cytotoxica]
MLSNEWRDVSTTYYTVVCWRNLAEHVAQSLDKGTSGRGGRPARRRVDRSRRDAARRARRSTRRAWRRSPLRVRTRAGAAARHSPQTGHQGDACRRPGGRPQTDDGPVRR